MAITTKEIKTRNKINLSKKNKGREESEEEEKKLPQKGKKMGGEDLTEKKHGQMVSIKWQGRQLQTPFPS